MSIKNKTKKRNACPHCYAKRCRRGFSLVEVLMATFVFAVIMVGVAGAFSSSVFGYRSAKNVQRDLEQAEFAMNLMAKTIRTSSVVSTPANAIVVFDYSRTGNKCIGYRLNGNTVQTADISAVDKAACASSPPSAYTDMATNVNSLAFSVTLSAPAVGATPATVGKVTISIVVGSGNDIARLQTTVSLRDYSVSGI